jgi:dTDP-4-amino-4,6-dideoxygalactose transaminase
MTDNLYYIDWVPKKNIDKEQINKLLDACTLTGRFTNYGPNVELLEKIIKDKLQIDDSKAIIVVSNGSVALHILTSAINYYHKNIFQWATQSFTFPASAQGTLSNVKILDIDLDGGIDISMIDETVNGLIVTNIFGNVVDIDKYVDYCNKNNKFLIFDNAATAFTFYKGKNCINYGDGCTISFHHTKPFGFGEGGAIIVDKKYEKIIRCLINFGINLTDNYYIPEGNNSKMSEISAVFIIQYLENNFDLIIKTHKNLYYYLKGLLETKYIHLNCSLFPSFHNDIITPACFPLLFEKYNDNIMLSLLNNGIFCRKYYHPLNNTPNSTNIYNKILCIPCTKDMTNANIDNILNLMSMTINV